MNAAVKIVDHKKMMPKKKLDEEIFRQIHWSSTREITWTIRDFKSLSAKKSYALNSPPFKFENASWSLRLIVRSECDSVGFKLRRLSSEKPRHTLNYNLFWPDGYYNRSFQYDSDNDDHTCMQYFAGLVRSRKTMSIAETQPFTLVCQISSFTLPVADAFSQTEEETGDICINFKDLLLNGQDYDFVLRVKDKEFRAHQNILRARSRFFETMLGHDMIEKQSGTVDIPDCDPDAFEQFLLYLYSGNVETMDLSIMSSLYRIADKYDMGQLKEQCREFIKDSVTSTNVTDVVQFAVDHSDDDVLQFATDYFARRVSVVLATEEWQSFAQHHSIQANELFMKAADICTSEKKSSPENTRHDFKHIHLGSTREITWKIQNFKGLLTTKLPLYSPPFEFENATWCLRFYPQSWKNHIGFTIVRVSSNMPHHRLRYSLMWSDGCYGVHSIVSDFAENHEEHGSKSFIDRLRYASIIDGTDFLELKCQISSCSSSVVNTFTQTVQGTKGIEDLCQDFKNMLLNGGDHDLVITVKDKAFPAHSNILRARSPFFESMLGQDTVEKNGGLFDIPDCDPKDFEQFLLYLYVGEVKTLDADNMLTLYDVAQKHEARHLKKQCRRVIKNSLTSTNVCKVIDLAANQSDGSLSEHAASYFVKHVKEVLRTAEWESLGRRNFTLANELFTKAADKWDMTVR